MVAAMVTVSVCVYIMVYKSAYICKGLEIRVAFPSLPLSLSLTLSQNLMMRLWTFKVFSSEGNGEPVDSGECDDTLQCRKVEAQQILKIRNYNMN